MHHIFYCYTVYSPSNYTLPWPEILFLFACIATTGTEICSLDREYYF